LKDPNCHCIDPTQDLVLNPNAWVDAPPGQFGKTAPYLNDYRWQRQPSESMSLARSFVVNRERNVKFEVRTEFYNVFNRLFLSSPEPVKLSGGGGGILVGANPAAPTTKDNQGRLTGGYGYVKLGKWRGITTSIRASGRTRDVLRQTLRKFAPLVPQRRTDCVPFQS
jgi:hypothetical protein